MHAKWVWKSINIHATICRGRPRTPQSRREIASCNVIFTTRVLHKTYMYITCGKYTQNVNGCMVYASCVQQKKTWAAIIVWRLRGWLSEPFCAVLCIKVTLILAVLTAEHWTMTCWFSFMVFCTFSLDCCKSVWQ